MKVMIEVDANLFGVIGGALMLARRAPTLLLSQLTGGEAGDGLPREAAEPLVKWASTVKVLAFDDDALDPETEAAGIAYFDDQATAALCKLMDSAASGELMARIKTVARGPIEAPK